MTVVGVDIGTQSLKAVACDAATMAPLGEASETYAPRYPRPGWAEQEPADWERALAPAIAGALAAAGRHPASVLGVAVAGQLDGCVPTDAAGHASGPCLIWSDRRAHAEAGAVPAEQLRHITGITADGSHMAAKIRWLGAGSAARFHQPVSYLVARLTGEHVFDHGLASTTMLYDLRARDYDDGLLAAFGIERARLPRIDDAAAVAGALHGAGAALTGLPVGTPVAVGTGDDFSTPLGAGLREGDAVCVLGTAEVVGALAGGPVIDDSGLVETHAYVDGRYFVENPGWLAGGAVEWLCGTLQLAGARELDRLAAAVAPGGEGVSFLPALSGAMAPEWVATARGCFYGLTAAHGPGHFARALLEACAFAMRDVLDRLDALGIAARELVLLGGGARSALWAQIRADVAGRAVRIPARVDTSPLGAAALAAVAAGAQPDALTAAGLLAGDSERLEPSGADYEPGYRRYRALFDALRPLY